MPWCSIDTLFFVGKNIAKNITLEKNGDTHMLVFDIEGFKVNFEFQQFGWLGYHSSNNF